jgi:hypothetical protein
MTDIGVVLDHQYALLADGEVRALIFDSFGRLL